MVAAIVTVLQNAANYSGTFNSLLYLLHLIYLSVIIYSTDVLQNELDQSLWNTVIMAKKKDICHQAELCTSSNPSPIHNIHNSTVLKVICTLDCSDLLRLNFSWRCDHHLKNMHIMSYALRWSWLLPEKHLMANCQGSLINSCHLHHVTQVCSFFLCHLDLCSLIFSLVSTGVVFHPHWRVF